MSKIKINPSARDVSTYTNTEVWWDEDGDRVRVRLHQTVIFDYDGHALVLDTGGWKTPTTKKRINECFRAFGLRELGFSIYSKRGELLLDRPTDKGVESVSFHDGIAVIVPNASQEVL